jgi:hypothetical protein
MLFNSFTHLMAAGSKSAMTYWPIDTIRRTSYRSVIACVDLYEPGQQYVMVIMVNIDGEDCVHKAFIIKPDLSLTPDPDCVMEDGVGDDVRLHVKACVGCGAGGVKRCSGCRDAFYCGAECQELCGKNPGRLVHSLVYFALASTTPR